METFTKSDFIAKLKFKGTWRDYQARCLKSLNLYLNDNKLNIVAAPGAGKTTLGVEVISKLKNNALILTPSITIKNQWKQRIVENFCEEKSFEGEISTDYQKISPITIITYQALHTVFKDKDKKEKFIEELKEKEVKTIVFDEAHHLRTEWYKTIEELLKILGEKTTTVSLTGTPPYDVTPSEWKNYNKIAGDVDAEISIPELVKAGDLCPHQDLIWFADLCEEEKTAVEKNKNAAKAFFDFINNSPEFLNIIKNSPFITDLDANIELIYEDTDFTISLISWLLTNDSTDMEGMTLCEFLQLKRENIPSFNEKLAETLINGIIGKYEKYFKNSNEIKNALKKLNLLSAPKKVDFEGTSAIKKVAVGKSKIQSIKEITKIEYKNLNKNLREVILLDFVQKGETFYLNALSVFNEISKEKNIKTGVLTGSTIIIPNSAKDELIAIANKIKIKQGNLLISPYDEEHSRVICYSDTPFVKIITELFEKGLINVLIGTTALLGEGWDCPSVNTLIIASTVGSFMLSNQIRGRALRINKNDPNKTADIWHLISKDKNYSADFEIIKRRFSSFEGINSVGNNITNGIERLGIGNIFETQTNKLNYIMAKRSAQRDFLNENWKQIFQQSQITEAKIVQKMYEITASPIEIKEITIKFIPKGIETLINKFLKNRKIKKERETRIKIAYAILRVLCSRGLIKTPYDTLKIKAILQSDNELNLTLLNAQNREISMFTKALIEIYSKPQEQKYLFKKDEKYIAIPAILSSNRKAAEELAKYLMPILGYLDIILTRTPNGRCELLKSKYNTYFNENISSKRIWL